MKGPLIFLAAFAAAAILFTLAPGIDLWAAQLFWSPDQGFFLRDWPPFRLAYQALPIITWILAVGLAVLLAIIILGERNVGRFDRKLTLYLLLTFIIGPGLLANTVLKDHWGRARPSQVVELGGTKQFTPALIPSDQCGRNCSFVSGHGAMAFSLVAFAAVPATLRRRRLVAAAALSFGAFVGLARIAQGGHFLSDTIFAGFLMIATAWLLHRWVVVADGLSHPLVGRGGRALARLSAGLHAAGHFFAAERWRRWLAFDLACLAAILISIAAFDRPLARYFHQPDDRLSHFFVWFAQFGLGWGWLVLTAGATIALLALAQAPRFATMRERFTAWALVPLFLFASVALAGILADILKILAGRTRPKLLFSDDLYSWGALFAGDGAAWHADHWSFPSGHTANVAALVCALWMLWPRHVASYVLFVALIALCRVGADQHYLSDTIGSVWLAIVTCFYVRGIYRRSGIRLQDAKAGVIAPLAPVSWARRLLPVYPHSL